MKDSKGREYDGWILKSESGRLFRWTFHRTRREVLGKHDYPWARSLKAVKVRIVEVVE